MGSRGALGFLETATEDDRPLDDAVEQLFGSPHSGFEKE